MCCILGIICSIFISARLKTENMIKGTIEHVKHDIADTYRWTESVSPGEPASTTVITFFSTCLEIRKHTQTYRSISVDKEYGRKSSELYEKFSRNICSKQNSRRCFQSSWCYQSSTQVQNYYKNNENKIFSVRDRYLVEDLLMGKKDPKLTLFLMRLQRKMKVLMRMNYLLLYKNKLNV